MRQAKINKLCCKDRYFNLRRIFILFAMSKVMTSMINVWLEYFS